MKRLIIGALLAATVLAGTPARAQVPIPAVPPEAAPVLEIIAPVASPTCGTAVLLAALAPGLIQGQLGTPLPVDISPVLGVPFAVCGSIPVPGQRVKCTADEQVAGAIATVTGLVAGTALPLDTSILGPIVGEVFAVQDQLPAPASTAGLAETISTTLMCTVVAGNQETEAEPEEEPVTEEEFVEDLLAFDEVPLIDDLPPLDSAVAGTELGSSSGPQLQSAIDNGPFGFAYPVVFALPLVLLVLGGYLGRMLTRSVAAPPQNR